LDAVTPGAGFADEAYFHQPPLRRRARRAVAGDDELRTARREQSRPSTGRDEWKLTPANARLD